MLTAAISNGEQVSSLEVSGAHAISNHVGVLANASWGIGQLTETYALSSAKDSVNEEGTRRHLVEVGGGYFKPIGGQGVFEIYGGTGLGSVYNYYDTQKLSYSNVKFSRFFVQPGLGFKSPYFDLAFSLRLASVHYYSIRPYNMGEPAWRDANALQLLTQNRSYLLSEPALTVRAGNKGIKCQLQFGYSYSMGAKKIHQDNINTSFGISVNLLPKSSTRQE